MAESPVEAYQVLARKYRPGAFADMIGQDVMVRILKNAFASDRIAHAFIMTGVRGVGKTTTARILAKALNCVGPDGNGGATTEPCGECEHCRAISEGRHVDVLEMDAASRTGIADIREIIEGIHYSATSARFKIYIIDEVHMLSNSAFNALLKTLEEPPKHVKFVFATTEIRKVPVTVLSRCQRFDLRRVEPEVMIAHLKSIAQSEGASISDDAHALIARAAEGSVRDALSLLDQAIAHGGGETSAEQVRSMLGLADRGRVLDLFEKVMSGDAAGSLEELRDQYRSGAEPLAVLRDLAEVTHWLSVVRVTPDSAEDHTLSPDERRRGVEMSSKLAMRMLARAWQMLLKALDEVATAPNPVMAAEMAIIRLTHVAELPVPEELVKKIQGAASSSSPAPRPAAAGGNPAGGSAALGQPGAVAQGALESPGAHGRGQAPPSPSSGASAQKSPPAGHALASPESGAHSAEGRTAGSETQAQQAASRKPSESFASQGQPQPGSGNTAVTPASEQFVPGKARELAGQTVSAQNSAQGASAALAPGQGADATGQPGQSSAITSSMREGGGGAAHDSQATRQAPLETSSGTAQSMPGSGNSATAPASEKPTAGNIAESKSQAAPAESGGQGLSTAPVSGQNAGAAYKPGQSSAAANPAQASAGTAINDSQAPRQAPSEVSSGAAQSMPGPGNSVTPSASGKPTVDNVAESRSQASPAESGGQGLSTAPVYGQNAGAAYKPEQSSATANPAKASAGAAINDSQAARQAPSEVSSGTAQSMPGPGNSATAPASEKSTDGNVAESKSQAAPAESGGQGLSTPRSSEQDAGAAYNPAQSSATANSAQASAGAAVNDSQAARHAPSEVSSGAAQSMPGPGNSATAPASEKPTVGNVAESTSQAAPAESGGQGLQTAPTSGQDASGDQKSEGLATGNPGLPAAGAESHGSREEVSRRSEPSAMPAQAQTGMENSGPALDFGKPAHGQASESSGQSSPSQSGDHGVSTGRDTGLAGERMPQASTRSSDAANPAHATGGIESQIQRAVPQKTLDASTAPVQGQRQADDYESSPAAEKPAFNQTSESAEPARPGQNNGQGISEAADSSETAAGPSQMPGHSEGMGNPERPDGAAVSGEAARPGGDSPPESQEPKTESSAGAREPGSAAPYAPGDAAQKLAESSAGASQAGEESAPDSPQPGALQSASNMESGAREEAPKSAAREGPPHPNPPRAGDEAGRNLSQAPEAQAHDSAPDEDAKRLEDGGHEVDAAMESPGSGGPEAPLGGESAGGAASPPAGRIQTESIHADFSAYPEFADVLGLIKSRDFPLLIRVEQQVRLVSYSPGRIELQLAEGCSEDLVERLGARLREWTNAWWDIKVAQSGGGPTLGEVREAERQETLLKAAEHPLARAVMEAVPGARVVGFRKAGDIGGKPEGEAADIGGELLDEDDPFQDNKV